ncbi:hypothetical protein [Campylobacter volucris]|nr:hypothetical protein [Campylobacter volucris]
MLINDKSIENFAITMEEIVVLVAEDKISKNELKNIIKDFLNNG